MSEVRDSELYFLVLHWLKSGPCQEAADVLQRTLQDRRLLPSIPSFASVEVGGYEALCSVYRHVPPSALRELVEECVLLQKDDHNASLTGAVSLLEATGSLSSIPSVRSQLTPSTVVVPPPSCHANFTQRLLQRECNGITRPISNSQLMENISAHLYKALQHNKTLRGHRKAVYCVAMDNKQRYAITGADDGIIKIWEIKIGLLRATCRGHVGEITDVKINCSGNLFASSSNDKTTRVWSLREDTLGQHVKSMDGHTNGVTFIAFHPTVETALLSVSLDGTCRLWHAVLGIEMVRLKPVGKPGRFYNAMAFEIPLKDALAAQQAARFAADTDNVDCALTCCGFSPRGDHFAVSSQSGKCFLWSWDVLSAQDRIGLKEKTWPNVSQTIELSAHNEFVPLLMFNHDGSALCTASSKGDVKIWMPVRNIRRTLDDKANKWDVCCSLKLPDPLPCPSYNNRRRRRSPECNQIAWSCDDRHILAAYSCSVIMVWNAITGEEENILYGGHANSPVHVLDAHPTDPKLCFSAGYDGMLVVWDILNGHKIIEMSSQDTHPGRYRWADPLQFVDGHFYPNGMGIIVSDVAGQFHLYGLDASEGIIRRTPYDQFFLYDYDNVIIDTNGDPVDSESSEPQHIHRTRFTMVDVTGLPYESPMQEILVSRKDLWQLPSPEAQAEVPPALICLPATMTAAAWLADEMGLGHQATETRVVNAQMRQRLLMIEMGEQDVMADYLPPEAAEEIAETEPESEEEADGSEYEPEEVEPNSHSPPATRRSERIQTRAGRRDSSPRRRRMPTRQNPEVVIEEFAETHEDDSLDLGEDQEEVGTDGLISDIDTADFSGVETASSDSEPPPPVRMQRRRRRRPHRVPRPERRSTRRRRLNRTVCASPSIEATPLAERSTNAVSERSLRAARRAAAAETAAQTANLVPTVSAPESSQPPETHRNLHEPDPEHAGINYAEGRDVHAYAWLSESRRPLGYYVPQIGDDAVFFGVLHKHFCEKNPALATRLPSGFIEAMRFAEPCRVTAVSYEIFRDGDLAPTVVRVSLKLTDVDRYGDHSTFEIVIPPPSFGHEEFLISQTLFVNSMNAEWIPGQECKVFYYGDLPEWWKGEIVDDMNLQVHTEDVWSCDSHYRRYVVQWTDHADANPECFSPWEVAPLTVGQGPSRVDVLHHDSLDNTARRLLLRTLADAKDRPEAEHFRETLPPEASFLIPGRTRRDTRTLFYNHVVPLPMSLKLVKTRLQNPTYYTSVDGFKQDIQLIVDNANLFTEPTSAVACQAEALQGYILLSIEHLTDNVSESPDSEEELRSLSRIYRNSKTHEWLSAGLDRGRSSISNPYAAPPVEGQYGIRTRGMAKRERESENTEHPSSRRSRRRYHK